MLAWIRDPGRRIEVSCLQEYSRIPMPRLPSYMLDAVVPHCGEFSNRYRALSYISLVSGSSEMPPLYQLNAVVPHCGEELNRYRAACQQKLTRQPYFSFNHLQRNTHISLSLALSLSLIIYIYIYNIYIHTHV